MAEVSPYLPRYDAIKNVSIVQAGTAHEWFEFGGVYIV
jgi:hypothetical protein